MAWLQLWTVGLVAALSLLPAVAEVPGLVVEAGNPSPSGLVKKQSYPVLFRQKRDWIWNSLYVEEEKPVPTAYKIGQVIIISSH